MNYRKVFSKSTQQYRPLLFQIILVFLFLSVFAPIPRVYALSVSSIKYSNDPNTNHYQKWGPSTVITVTNWGGNAVLNGSWSCGTYAANTQCGGWDQYIEGSGNGAVFTVTPGGASCTHQKVNGYHYCGVSVPNPDSDGDGVPDSSDACKNDPGPAANGGCPWPDSDNDGYTDNVDSCPNQGDQGFGLKSDGCPKPEPKPGDGDGDGVLDGDDACPNEPGSADNNGCPPPDGDGDGVPDILDQCHEIPGPSWNAGCPPEVAVSEGAVTSETSATPTAPPHVILDKENDSCLTATSLQIGDRINVRAKPTTDSSILGAFEPWDGPFTVTGFYDGWYRIDYNGEVGWVRGDLIQEPVGTMCSIAVTNSIQIIQDPEDIYADCENKEEAIAWFNEQESQLQLAYSYDEDPCRTFDALATAEAQEQNVFANIGYNSMKNAVDSCGADVVLYVDYLSENLDPSDPVWDTIEDKFKGNIDCKTIVSDLVKLTGLNPDLLNSCDVNDPSKLDTLLHLSEELGLSSSDIDTNMCSFLNELSLYTSKLAANQVTLYNKLLNCPANDATAAINLLNLALAKGANISELVNLSNDTLCNYDKYTKAVDDNSLPPMPAKIRFCAKPNQINGDAIIFWELANQENSLITQDYLDEVLGLPRPHVCKHIKIVRDNDWRPVEIVPPTPTPTPTETEPPPDLPPPPPPIPVDVVENTRDAVNIQHVSDTGDTGGAETVYEIGIFSNVLDEANAVFTGQSEDGQSTDIYIFSGGEYYAMFPNSPENEYYPNFRGPDDIEIVYLREIDDEVVLVYYLPPFHEYEFSAPEGYTFDTNSRIGWHPDLPIVYVTLLDEDGKPYIYQFNLDDSNTTPVLTNAKNPVRNETHLIYERIEDTGSTIEVQLIQDGLMNGSASNPVFSLPGDATDCYAPAPLNQDKIIFICDNQIYLGDLFGLDSPQSFAIPEQGTIANISYVPNIGYYFTFDDGTTIFLMDAGSKTVEDFLRVSIENTSYMNWR